MFTKPLPASVVARIQRDLWAAKAANAKSYEKWLSEQRI